MDEENKTREKVTDIDMAMEAACTTTATCNAPMLVSWIFKNVEEEPTLIRGMKFVLDHMETGEGCEMLLNNDIVSAIFKAIDFHKSNQPIILLCISVLRQLLDCNFTRDRIIGDVSILRTCFNIGYQNMNSPSHVEYCCHCITQCSRSEVNRQDILKRNIVGYCTMFSEKYPMNPKIVRSVLKLYNWVTTTQERMESLCKTNAVGNTLKCMKRHKINADVLAPGMLFLTRAASSYAPAMAYILRKRAVPIVVDALRALHSNEVLQLEGLKMLQTLSRTTEGWNQISSVKGAWQAITQGTSLGDALVHDLPGELNNPGWCIGETPHLPVNERKKLLAAKAAQAKTVARPNAAWTNHSLREYMGLSMNSHTLEVNNVEHDTKFEVLQSLDLLPFPGEEREYWFIRIKEYEVDNEIRIDDMVVTVMEMRAKESKEAKEAAKLAQLGPDYVKELYVMGQRVTTESLVQADMSAAERLQGIIDT